MDSYQKLDTVDIEMDEDIGRPLLVETSFPSQKKTQRRHRSCAYYLCGGLCLVLGLLLGLAVLASIWAYGFLSREVQEWTVTDPGPPLPVVLAPIFEMDDFENQAEVFYETLQEGRSPPNPLVATAKVINGFLVLSRSDFLRGNAWVHMEANEVLTLVRSPMDAWPGGKGRFLVGTQRLRWDPTTSSIHISLYNEETGKVLWDAKFLLEKDESVWRLQVLSGQFLDWVLPQDFIQEEVNLLEDFYHCHRHDQFCQEMRTLLDGLSEISLEEDQVVLRATKKDHEHRALGAANAATAPNHWKIRLARHLAGI